MGLSAYLVEYCSRVTALGTSLLVTVYEPENADANSQAAPAPTTDFPPTENEPTHARIRGDGSAPLSEMRAFCLIG